MMGIVMNVSKTKFPNGFGKLLLFATFLPVASLGAVAIGLAILAQAKIVFMGDSIVARGDLNGYGAIAAKVLSSAKGVPALVRRSSEYTNPPICEIMPLNIQFLKDSVTSLSPDVFHFNPGIDMVTGSCGSREAHFAKYAKDLEEYIIEFKKQNPNKVFLYGLNTRPDDCVVKNSRICQRKDVDVRELNAVARSVALKMEVPSNDLHSLGIREKYGTTDGRHLDLKGGLGSAKFSVDATTNYLPYGSKSGAPWVYITKPEHLVSPIHGKEFESESDVSLEVAAGGASIKRVEFYDGTEKIGEDANKPYSIVWKSSKKGMRHLTAVLVDDADRRYPSPEVRVYLNGPLQTTQLPLKVNVGGTTEVDGYLPDKVWSNDAPYGFSGYITYRVPSKAGGAKNSFGPHQSVRLSQGENLTYRVRVGNKKVNIALHFTRMGSTKPNNTLFINGNPVKESIAPNWSEEKGAPVSLLVQDIQPVNGIVTIEFKVKDKKSHSTPITGFIVSDKPIPQSNMTGRFMNATVGLNDVVAGKKKEIAHSSSTIFNVLGRKTNYRPLSWD